MADGDAARLFPGVPYSYSASTSGGTVFTAGACPLDADGKVVAEGDVAEQTQQTRSRLSARRLTAALQCSLTAVY